MSNIEQVGARMVLLDGPKFKTLIDAATKSVQAFNDAQRALADTSKAASDSMKTETAVTADNTAEMKAAAVATKAQADAQNALGASALSNMKKVSTGALGVSASLAKLSAASTKILKYASVGGAALVYEGIKNYNSFQQMIAQSAIDAGVKTSQLGAFSKMAIQVSNSTGIAATNVADMMYRIASANPGIGTTTKAMKAMVTQAGNLAVLAGATGDPDSIARMYGAIVSNHMSLTRGGKPLTYSTAGAKSINEWTLATTGHGDMKTGDLIAAMGTGLLPVAKTYGLSLNDIGAMIDVLSPAMNATSASTRLKTAIGMIGSPSQKASQALELTGGSSVGLASALRTSGPMGMVNYLKSLETKAMSGSSFIGGGIFGAASGKYSGISGAADWLKAYGFTNSGLVSLLQSKGAKGLVGMSSSQLQGFGFAKGTTGTNAAKTIVADIIGQMFGGGHTGAAIMQEVNESGMLGKHLSALSGSENPKSYAAALTLAFKEPIVAFNKFEQGLKNMTIAIGKYVTPAFDGFLSVLEKLGGWFGRNKWAIDSLLDLGGILVGGAALIKAYALATKLRTSVSVLTGGGLPTSLLGGSSTTALEAGAAASIGKTIFGAVAKGALAYMVMSTAGKAGLTQLLGKTAGTAWADVLTPTVAGAVAGGSLGSAIFPGLGTAIGAALGGSAGFAVGTLRVTTAYVDQLHADTTNPKTDPYMAAANAAEKAAAKQRALVMGALGIGPLAKLPKGTTHGALQQAALTMAYARQLGESPAKAQSAITSWLNAGGGGANKNYNLAAASLMGIFEAKHPGAKRIVPLGATAAQASAAANMLLNPQSANQKVMARFVDDMKGVSSLSIKNLMAEAGSKKFKGEDQASAKQSTAADHQLKAAQTIETAATNLADVVPLVKAAFSAANISGLANQGNGKKAARQ